MIPRATAKRLEASGLATIAGNRVYDTQLALPLNLYQPGRRENRLLAPGNWPEA